MIADRSSSHTIGEPSQQPREVANPLKQDYLAYIEEESQLHTLRCLRKKLVAHDEVNKKSKKMKKSVPKFSEVARILEICTLAVI